MKKLLIYSLCIFVANCSVPTSSDISTTSTTVKEFIKGKSIVELNYNNRCGESIRNNKACNNSIFGNVGNRNFDGFYIANGNDSNNIGDYQESQHKIEIRLTNNLLGNSVKGSINQRKVDIKINKDEEFLNLNGDIGGQEVSIRIKSSKATVATGYVGNEIVALNHRYETPNDKFDDFEVTQGGQIYGTSDNYSPFIVLLIILFSQHSDF